MTLDTVFKLLFGGTMATGIGLTGWKEVSYYFDSKTAFHEFERIYGELGDYFNQEIRHIPNQVIKNKMEYLIPGCYERINLFVPKTITRTYPISGKLRDERTQRRITRETFKVAGAEPWSHILRDNMDNYKGLINYTKILKRACEVYAEGEEEITLEFGHVPQTYRLFTFAGVKTQWGFRVKNEKFKNILYGAIEGDYQSMDGYETNIDRALEKIS